MPVLVPLGPEENICELMLSTLYSTRHAALDPWPEVTSEVGNSILLASSGLPLPGSDSLAGKIAFSQKTTGGQAEIHRGAVV